jgi:hypothetical protein
VVLRGKLINIDAYIEKSKRSQDWNHGSVEEHLPSKSKALNPISGTTKKF